MVIVSLPICTQFNPFAETKLVNVFPLLVNITQYGGGAPDT